jgi:hypothetical protein
MAFNALYTTVRGHNPEHVAVGDVVRHYLNPLQASAVLDAIEPRHIRALFRIPPGDMRRGPADADFRLNATREIAIFRNPARTDVERLAALMKVVYQVRSNLVHASKNPRVQRDHNLVSVCIPIMDAILRVLVQAVR